MSISYDQLKTQLVSPAVSSSALVEQLSQASLDSFYIHQLLFQAEQEGRVDVQVLLRVMQDDLGWDYIEDVILLCRNDEGALQRLYQLAYDEEQMMRLVLLCSYLRNAPFVYKFLHYFEVSPSVSNGRSLFVQRAINLCMDCSFNEVIPSLLAILPDAARSSLSVFVLKAYRQNNEQVAHDILQLLPLSQAIDALMKSDDAQAAEAVDWLLKDAPTVVWRHHVQAYPGVGEHIYSQRRRLIDSVGEDGEDPDKRKM